MREKLPVKSRTLIVRGRGQGQRDDRALRQAELVAGWRQALTLRHEPKAPGVVALQHRRRA